MPLQALRKALTRHPRAHVDMTTGNAIYTYLNLSAKAQALAVGPNGVLGSGFGNAGLYQVHLSGPTAPMSRIPYPVPHPCHV